MKTLIYFNFNDKPENMGISQLTDDVQQFLAERSDILINPVITENIITFVKQDGANGYAVMCTVPSDFQN